VATILVDHYSDYTFVYLQRTTSAQDTLAAKHEFERSTRSMGISIERYHSDNGRFAENFWQEDLRHQKQYGSYCGVNAHHQIGKIEKRILDLQDNTPLRSLRRFRPQIRHEPISTVISLRNKKFDREQVQDPRVSIQGSSTQTTMVTLLGLQYVPFEIYALGKMFSKPDPVHRNQHIVVRSSRIELVGILVQVAMDLSLGLITDQWQLSLPKFFDTSRFADTS
jgi:hypothetical protein